MTAQDHNKLLSILFMAKGGLITIAAVVIVVVYGLFGLIFGGALMSAGKGEEKLVGAGLGAFFVIFAIVLGLFLLLFAGVYLMAAWKLHKGRQSAKTWATVASCFALLNFPLGTALGIYALWFLFGDMGKQLYSGGGPGGNYPSTPPSPHNWQ